MKIQVISDVHLEMFGRRDEFNRFFERLTGGIKKSESILCIAGDLGVFHRLDTWREPLVILARQYRAVVCVAGNHEYYCNNIFNQEKKLMEVNKLPANVHYLFNDTVTINNTQFIGGTLWTSFFDRQLTNMEYATIGMDDFKLIKNRDGSTLSPEQTVHCHEICKSFIFNQVRAAKLKKQKTVVISHHCISPLCVHPQYHGDLLNAAFFTDLNKEIIRNGPDIWLHGHTHHSLDFTLGLTRVVCNPFGCLRRDENLDFDFRLKISF